MLQASINKGSYAEFSNMVRAQASRLVFNRRPPARGGANLVDDQDRRQTPDVAAVSQLSQQARQPDERPAEQPTGGQSIEELTAAVLRKTRDGKRDPVRTNPRKCANCGGTHPELKCPHPEVAREARKCWTCGKTGHSNRDCPARKAAQSGSNNSQNSRAIKALEDMDLFQFCVEEEPGGVIREQ